MVARATAVQRERYRAYAAPLMSNVATASRRARPLARKTMSPPTSSGGMNAPSVSAPPCFATNPYDIQKPTVPGETTWLRMFSFTYQPAGDPGNRLSLTLKWVSAISWRPGAMRARRTSFSSISTSSCGPCSCGPVNRMDSRRGLSIVIGAQQRRLECLSRNIFKLLSAQPISAAADNLSAQQGEDDQECTNPPGQPVTRSQT